MQILFSPMLHGHLFPRMDEVKTFRFKKTGRDEQVANKFKSLCAIALEENQGLMQIEHHISALDIQSKKGYRKFWSLFMIAADASPCNLYSNLNNIPSYMQCIPAFERHKVESTDQERKGIHCGGGFNQCFKAKI